MQLARGAARTATQQLKRMAAVRMLRTAGTAAGPAAAPISRATPAAAQAPLLGVAAPLRSSSLAPVYRLHRALAVSARVPHRLQRALTITARAQLGEPAAAAAAAGDAEPQQEQEQQQQAEQAEEKEYVIVNFYHVRGLLGVGGSLPEGVQAPPWREGVCPRPWLWLPNTLPPGPLPSACFHLWPRCTPPDLSLCCCLACERPLLMLRPG